MLEKRIVRFSFFFAFGFIFMGITQPVLGGPIDWTDWTSATAGLPGSASGDIGSVTIRYSGEVNGVLTQTSGTGTDWWVEYSPAPYTGSPIVDNRPPAGEMIGMRDSNITNTINFSQPVTNPIMAIVSQGRVDVGVRYDFDTSYTVLSEGWGYWGDGSYVNLAGDVLQGYEFHGVIQFSGTFSSIGWVNLDNEYWHGFTVGLPSPIPEPTSLLLLGTGLGVLWLGVNRRKRK